MLPEIIVAQLAIHLKLIYRLLNSKDKPKLFSLKLKIKEFQNLEGEKIAKKMLDR